MKDLWYDFLDWWDRFWFSYSRVGDLVLGGYNRSTRSFKTGKLALIISIITLIIVIIFII